MSEFTAVVLLGAGHDRSLFDCGVEPLNVREKGQGLGKALLKDAVLRTLQAAGIAGLKAIFVQAKDEDGQQFYAKHGFIPSPGDPLHLFFPLAPLHR
jgi:GNAT superfamily N-acetyltransferase